MHEHIGNEFEVPLSRAWLEMIHISQLVVYMYYSLLGSKDGDCLLHLMTDNLCVLRDEGKLGDFSVELNNKDQMVVYLKNKVWTYPIIQIVLDKNKGMNNVSIIFQVVDIFNSFENIDIFNVRFIDKGNTKY